MIRIYLFLLVSIVGAFCCQESNAQSLYQKSHTFYFNLDSIGTKVPYASGTANVYQKNDSLVYDLRFNKLLRKLTVTSYKKDDFYSDGYAPPLAVMKYKASKPRLDTISTQDSNKGKTVYSISKYYPTKLLNRIDYFKFESK